MSTEKLDLKGSNDIKKVISPEYINKLLSRSSAMMALVTQKAAKSQEASSVELIVDLNQGHYLQFQEREKSFSKFYIYNVESLATTFREYRTLRLSEFYAMSQTIVSPTFIKEKAQPEMNEFEKAKRAKMNEFCEVFKD